MLTEDQLLQHFCNSLVLIAASDKIKESTVPKKLIDNWLAIWRNSLNNLIESMNLIPESKIEAYKTINLTESTIRTLLGEF